MGVDLDTFDDHLRAAQRAEHDDTPSIALDHYQAAAAMYRGELYADLPRAEWFDGERERYRLRFVDAAVRAAHLLIAIGRLDEGERLAERTLSEDPWSEPASGVLVSVALGRGDRSGAWRQLQRSLQIVADLGAEPSEETIRLQRELRGRTA